MSFAVRLAYVRWLNSRGALSPESDSDLAKRAGLGNEWLAKWKKRDDAPNDRTRAGLLVAALGADPGWLLDGVGNPPEPELYVAWERAGWVKPADPEKPANETPTRVAKVSQGGIPVPEPGTAKAAKKKRA